MLPHEVEDLRKRLGQIEELRSLPTIEEEMSELWRDLGFTEPPPRRPPPRRLTPLRWNIVREIVRRGVAADDPWNFEKVGSQDVALSVGCTTRTVDDVWRRIYEYGWQDRLLMMVTFSRDRLGKHDQDRAYEESHYREVT